MDLELMSLTFSRAGANRALGISDGWFALVDSALLTGLARIALMPTLVMAARICPEVAPQPSQYHTS